jgi:hypothetical protein
LQSHCGFVLGVVFVWVGCLFGVLGLGLLGVFVVCGLGCGGGVLWGWGFLVLVGVWGVVLVVFVGGFVLVLVCW